MGLAAVGHHRVLPGLTAGDLMMASERVGEGIGKIRSLGKRLRGKPQELPPPSPPLTVITNAK
jgi:hypothetical protein